MRRSGGRRCALQTQLRRPDPTVTGRPVTRYTGAWLEPRMCTRLPIAREIDRVGLLEGRGRVDRGMTRSAFRVGPGDSELVRQ
jgi:hypothetical protein